MTLTCSTNDFVYPWDMQHEVIGQNIEISVPIVKVICDNFNIRMKSRINSDVLCNLKIYDPGEDWTL